MIPIAKPLMGEAEAEAASRVIRSGWTTQGPEAPASMASTDVRREMVAPRARAPLAIACVRSAGWM